MASGGEGKKVVGKLTIRVAPDMTGFREEVEGKANAAARGAHPEVEVDADTKKAERKIHEVTDKDYDARVDLDLDARGFREKLKAETRPTKVNVKVDYDESALDRVKKNIDRFLTNESLEMGRAHQRLSQVFRDAAPKPHKFDLKLDDAFDYQLRNRVEKAAQGAARVAERELSKIGDGGDRRSGIARLLGNVGGLAGNIKVPDLIPNIGGVGGLGSIAIIVGALSLVAPALALLSQALVGLPALITAVALPIGVVALGFKGIKDALDTSGFLDIITGKSKKDGTKGKDKNEPGQIIKDLQEKVSETFKTGLTPVFQQMAAALPALTRGLPFVAQGLVKMAEGFGNIIATPAFQQGFDRLTNSIGTMLTNLSPALQLFTSGMMNLITNVGDHLPGLGNKMTEWAGQFQNWVSKISKPQQDWFGKDIPNSSTLDKAVHNLGPELDSLFGSIGNLINRGLDLAGKGDIAKGIQDAITGLEHLLDQLSRLGPVFESIASILNAFPGIGTGVDPKAPYGTKPGPAGSNTTIPITHDEAMQQAVPFSQDPVQWIGDRAKDFLGHMFDGAKKFVTEQTIGGNLISMLLGGATPSANAAPQPFNAGTKVTPGQPPVPVQVVPGAGAASLFPGGPGNPIQPSTPLPQTSAGGQPIQAPKIEAPKLPPGSEKIWEPLIASTQAAAQTVNGAITSMVGQITASLQGLGPAGNAAGTALGTGLAGGIAASAPSALAAAQALGQGVADALRGPSGIDAHSPSKKSFKSGQDFAQGFDDGMSGGFQGVIDKASQLAAQVNDAMAETGVLSPHLKAQVAKETAAIGVEYDKLKEQAQGLDKKDPAKKDLQAQMKQLQALRTSLGADSKESAYNSKYGGGSGSDSTQQAASMITQALASGLDALKGMVMGNVGQLETDLGMSGNGVVEKLGDYGINFLTSGLNSMAQSAFGGQGGNTYNFQSMDHDGMMGQYERVKTRQSMEHTQRSN